MLNVVGFGLFMTFKKNCKKIRLLFFNFLILVAQAPFSLNMLQCMTPNVLTSVLNYGGGDFKLYAAE